MGQQEHMNVLSGRFSVLELIYTTCVYHDQICTYLTRRLTWRLVNRAVPFSVIAFPFRQLIYNLHPGRGAEFEFWEGRYPC